MKIPEGESRYKSVMSITKAEARMLLIFYFEICNGSSVPIPHLYATLVDEIEHEFPIMYKEIAEIYEKGEKKNAGTN